MSEHPVKASGAPPAGSLDSEDGHPSHDAGTGAGRIRTHQPFRPDPPSPRSRSPFARGFVVTSGAIVAIGLAVALALMSGVVFNVCAALFIALSLNPLVNLLGRRGLSRGKAIALVAVVFALLASVALVLVLPPVLRQGAELVRSLPGSLADLSNQPWVQSVNTATQGGADALLQWIADLAGESSFWAFVAGGALSLSTGLANWVSSGFFMAVLALYFLVSLKSMKRGFYSLISASKRHTAIYLTEKITASIGRYLGGMVVLAACNAAFSLVLLTLTGVPYAGAISFAAFFITLIPVIGTVVTTCFMTLFALLSSPTAGMIVLVAMLVYMQVEAYVMTPKAMGKALHIPGATVLISATAGGVLLGFAGALIANPVAAALTLIVRYVVVPRRNVQ